MNGNIRKTVEEFEPYAWELSSDELKAKYGVREVLRFDTNTLPSAYRLRAVEETLRQLALGPSTEYPDPSYKNLSARLASYAGVNENQLVICAGADEVIDVITKAFIDNGDKAIISTPTYSMFKICTQIMGGTPVSVARNADYSLDVGALASVAEKEKAKLVFVCNPNSPTGNQTSRSEIERLLQSTKSTVVVDEAYIEFSGGSLAELTRSYENLIVIRTLSKAFGLASWRVGYAISSPEIAGQLNKVRPPNSVSYSSVAVAEAALTMESIAEMRVNVGKIVAERKRLEAAFAEIGATIFPSACNFLLVKVNGALAVYDYLLQRGLVVRNFSSKPGLEGCLRITVRSPEENTVLLNELTRVLSGKRAEEGGMNDDF